MTEKERSQNSWQHVQLARRPDRPHTLDYIRLLTTDFLELHGDRHYGDDGAIVGGPARFAGRTVMIIGHQKGSTTKENLARNFAQAMPEGYRKALRLMRHAQKFGMPLLTFIDTPGANPGIESEERGQAQAIADNLLAMLQLEVPVISVVIGEGGSGGALAIGVADRILMLENAIYSVASPEASAAILWRDAGQARTAAEAMRITAQDLLQFGVADEIIPEPAGGAQNDVAAVIESTRTALLRHLRELENTYSQRGRLGIRKMLEQRAAKYTNIGMFLESAEAAVEAETDTADIGPALVAPAEVPLNGGAAHDSNANHEAEPTASANGTNGTNGAKGVAEEATPVATPTRQRAPRAKKQERPAE